MHISKTRKEGSSIVLVLPHAYARDLGIVAGDYVTLQPDHAGHIVIGRLEEYLHARTRTEHPPRRHDP